MNLVVDESMDVLYSYIKVLKLVGKFSFYLFVGVGVLIGENVFEDDGSWDSGYFIMGVYGLIGMYVKVIIIDKIWFNYNFFWLIIIGGSDNYKDYYYGLN